MRVEINRGLSRGDYRDGAKEEVCDIYDVSESVVRDRKRKLRDQSLNRLKD